MFAFDLQLVHLLGPYETLDHKVDGAADLLGCEGKKMNQLARNFEGEILAI